MIEIVIAITNTDQQGIMTAVIKVGDLGINIFAEDVRDADIHGAFLKAEHHLVVKHYSRIFKTKFEAEATLEAVYGLYRLYKPKVALYETLEVKFGRVKPCRPDEIIVLKKQEK